VRGRDCGQLTTHARHGMLPMRSIAVRRLHGKATRGPGGSHHQREYLHARHASRARDPAGKHVGLAIHHRLSAKNGEPLGLLRTLVLWYNFGSVQNASHNSRHELRGSAASVGACWKLLEAA